MNNKYTTYTLFNAISGPRSDYRNLGKGLTKGFSGERCVVNNLNKNSRIGYQENNELTTLPTKPLILLRMKVLKT